MRPRPRSRKNPLEVVPVADLVAAVEAIREEGGEPAAIVSGRREWLAVRAQPAAKGVIEFWPGDDETFSKVAVIIRSGWRAPVVYATQADLEEDLLDPARR